MSLLPATALRVLEPLVVLSDSDVLFIQAAQGLPGLPQNVSGGSLAAAGDATREACRQLQAFIVFRSSLARRLQVE